MEEPDILETKYSEKDILLINKYFKENTKYSELHNYDITFSYCNNKSANNSGRTFSNPHLIESDNTRYLSCISHALKNNTYDMIIVDDRFLFGDKYFTESFFLEWDFKIRNYNQYYVNLKEYQELINDHLNDFDYTLIKDGYFSDEEWYGLPYEMDFDTFYYDKSFLNSKNISLDHLTWNSFSLVPSFSEISNDIDGKTMPLMVGLNDDDELLNFFVEYTYDSIEAKSKENTNENEGKNSHYVYIDKMINNDETILTEFYNIKGDLKTPLKMKNLQQAYTSFLNEECSILKGKASYNHYFKNYYDINKNKNINNEYVSPSISVTLPPDNYSIINEKFLIINKNSELSKELLVKAAIQLTSKEMQFFRAEHFGNLPTIDINQRNEDSMVNSFCQNNQELCDLLKKLKPLHIKELFKRDEFSASFLEVRLLLPPAIRKFLNEYDIDDLKNTLSNIVNINVVNNSYHMDKYFFTIYIATVMMLIIIMILVYKNREHPHLKVISPNLCNLIIVGLIWNIIYPYFITHNKSVFLCQFTYLVGLVSRNLMILPMFVITFRIYLIYSNKTKIHFGKKLNDKNLLIIFALVIFIEVCFGIIIVMIVEFYIITLYDITENRIMLCHNNWKFFYKILMYIYYAAIILGVFTLIAKTRRVCKKYDEIKYIFIILIIIITLNLTDIIALYITQDIIYKYYIVIFMFYIICSFICVYLLVGSRLIYIFNHPSRDRSYSDCNNILCQDFYNAVDIADFIKLTKDEKEYYRNYKKNVKNQIKNINRMNSRDQDREKGKGRDIANFDNLFNTNNCGQINDSYYEDDSITYNPNNFFFNRSLEKLNSITFTYSNSATTLK